MTRSEEKSFIAIGVVVFAVATGVIVSQCPTWWFVGLLLATYALAAGAGVWAATKEEEE